MLPVTNVRKLQGKPEAFAPERRDVLLGVLRRLVAKEEERTGKKITGEQIGEWLGIQQQSVSRFLAGRGAGINYEPASRLARKAGFRKLDDLFEAYGVLDGQLPKPETGDDALNGAIQAARAEGIEEAVIQFTVTENRGEIQPINYNRRRRWWMKRFLAAQELTERARGELEPVSEQPQKKAN